MHLKPVLLMWFKAYVNFDVEAPSNPRMVSGELIS